MSVLRLILASLRHHGRMHAVVACGVAVATAVICGALIVGDSMRGSLRRLTLERLGRVELALVSDRFFRAELADEVASRAGLGKELAAAVPVILMQTSVARSEGLGIGDWGLESNPQSPIPNPSPPVTRVSLIGCDGRFWDLGPSRTGVPPVSPAHSPGDGQIVLNRPLAEALGVSIGQRVSVRIPRVGAISIDSPLGRSATPGSSEVLTVIDVIGAEGLGGLSLRPNQRQPRNAYVPLDWLNDRLAQRGGLAASANPSSVRANAILVAGPPGAADPVLDQLAIQAALHPTLADYGIRIQKTARGYWNATSDRMILEPAAEEAILKAAGPLEVQPALTYLANTIACGEREIPYSMVAAVDFTDRPPFGPMLTPEGDPIAPLDGLGEEKGDRHHLPERPGGCFAQMVPVPLFPRQPAEIVLNTWAVEQLQAKVGDTIRLDYFEPESTHGQVRQQSREFRLKAIVAMTGPAADPDFTPQVPGVSDKASIGQWDLPSLIDTRRVHQPDEDYWNKYRGTPKAFVSLATGRELWKSRFGQTTSLRVGEVGGRWNVVDGEPQPHMPPTTYHLPSLPLDIQLDPTAMGFIFQPVKRQGLAAAVGTTSFQELFLAFSSFLLIAAAILVALLFRLGIERRAAEIGILLAVGLRRRRVARLLAVEGLLVAALGGLAGIGLGIGYAALLVVGLRTWWLGAVVTPLVRLYVTPQSLAVGYASGVVVAVLAILGSVRRVARVPPRQLLAGDLTARGFVSARRRHRLAQIAAWAMLAAALGLGLFAARLGEEARAGAFFGAGALVLTAALTLVWTHLSAGSTGPAVAVGRGNLLRLAVRNAARNPGRSTLTIGLVAAACFLIVAVSAFRLDPSRAAGDPHGGTGGFALVAESDQPIFEDLNTDKGRRLAGCTPEESRALEGIRATGLRVRPGDDASCLNLYQPRQPRVLGVPSKFVERDGFAWAAVGAAVGAKPQAANPWMLLDADLGVVPVILEKNTAVYSLHLAGRVGETYDIGDDRVAGATPQAALGGVIVALLKDSIFQGDLLISEDAFVRSFPEQSGYRFFLIETAEGQDAGAVKTTLERGLAGFGLSVETAADRLAAFSAVQNTYLLTFQSLGALGLLLGTFGLAAVQMRSVLERRRELAVMRATGFGRRTLAGLVTLENAALLGGGLACGILAAVVAVLPHLFGGGASIPWGGLAGTLLVVFAVGLLAGLSAVRLVVAMPLVASLRNE